MASIKQISRLFTALAVSDIQAARGVASEITDEEERLGHHLAAQRLRGALTPNMPRVGGSSSTGLLSFRSLALSSALTEVKGRPGLTGVTLDSQARAKLVEVVREWRMRDRLKKAGVSRRTKLLFHGPPGCGKSLTACALGTELGLPVYVVRFDSIVGSYLGQTAIHLRELFEFAAVTPCVLLLDEVDAVGKQRGSLLDVGELDRIVISLMQEMEHSSPHGLIICTSNLPSHLDPALWRRYDFVLEFPKPEPKILMAFVTSLAEQYGLQMDVTDEELCGKCESFSEAERCVKDKARQVLLNEEFSNG